MAPQQLRFVREGGKFVRYDLMGPAAPRRELRDGDIVSIGELRAVFNTVADEACDV